VQMQCIAPYDIGSYNLSAVDSELHDVFVLWALGLTEPLTEMRTRNLPGGNRRPARKSDNLTAISELIVWKIWEPHRLNPMSLHGLLQGKLYLFLFFLPFKI
jgi:hypothetical protein